ncbi:hypothetical protein KQ302_00150 [Synechococcus sp. CS-602]|uniref:hypothetical protein n=1 Tax=Synechococcaceae TaxID=1890426 RepID=UPI0008FF7566|nr:MULTISPECIES: hypothetical protein [Synechococcaceae]APD49029.1 hypothetical protein BM449_13245 [Synechococcus sp. SynAce01]MCT0203535.1 hypothetical protein [Synechococcus sp. CS-602]MCT0244818.1 hypothetical protein [Synechococcus sp. CS-601]MCT4366082.1 hypothetical protein [Candidatus Regnicoccus frigidus MAG-AL2]TWB88251.1 hypothetical protein FB106_1178 [Synechococcus sp. Ace-Pa]
MATLSPEQLDSLQVFLKDWLRHSGRTQSDLRRALRAESIKMPALLEELQRLHVEAGLGAVAERLCAIETQWQSEEAVDPLAQLDLDLDALLNEIREGQKS